MYTGAIPASEGKITAASLASLTRLGPYSPVGEKGELGSRSFLPSGKLGWWTLSSACHNYKE